MSALAILEAGPALCLQDLGRPGWLACGLSRGGGADRRALFEAGALLGMKGGATAIEMAGFGGRFRALGGDIVVALTGAPMRARLWGEPLEWNSSHLIPEGEILDIGPALKGVYGYLAPSGGFDLPLFMGARSAHLNAGIGRRLRSGDQLQTLPGNASPGLFIPPYDRFSGGELRALPSPQIEMFDQETVERFFSTRFIRTPKGNRMGVELGGGESFAAKGGLGVVSEMISPGDIQMTGNGTPFVLGPECQTTGGYPRIATVIPADLDRAMQAAPGTPLTVRMVERSEALDASRADMDEIATLSARARVRNPSDIGDLLSYQLIGGAVTGDEE